MPLAHRLTVGHLNASIGDTLRDDPKLLSAFPFILVTCIDSNNSPDTMSDVCRRFPQCEPMSGSILVPGRLIRNVRAAFNFFTGFDEIWCFATRPRATKLRDASIVAPFDVISDDVETELVRWCRESKCQLGLGDGVGLNYITPDRALGAELERVADDPDARRAHLVTIQFAPEQTSTRTIPLDIVLDVDRENDVMDVEIISLLAQAGPNSLDAIAPAVSTDRARTPRYAYDATCDCLALKLSDGHIVDQRTVQGRAHLNARGQIVAIEAKWRER
jgi:uncharacterized protein YuzE